MPTYFRNEVLSDLLEMGMVHIFCFADLKTPNELVSVLEKGGRQAIESKK